MGKTSNNQFVSIPTQCLHSIAPYSIYPEPQYYKNKTTTRQQDKQGKQINILITSEIRQVE